MNFFANFNELEKTKNTYNKDLIRKVNKFSNKVLYGIGESCTEALKFFKQNSILINKIYDENPLQNNTYYDGVLVTLPDYNDLDTAIIVTCSFYNNIRLKALEYDKNIDSRLFVFDGYFLENLDNNYFNKHKEKINYCYNKLEDNESKILYEKLLEYRYLRDINIIKDLVDKNKCYFDKLLLDNFKEGTIIDAGAYIGNFMKDLSSYKDISNSMFYLFEPNSKLLSKINETLKQFNNYKVFQLALCDTNGKEKFNLMPTSTSHLMNDKYSAYKVSSNDMDEVELKKLDDIITNEKVTLIKVDIEGSEQAFLKGATNTITKNKPILLLSVYHKIEDMWELLYYIDKLDLGYKFYLKHYSMSVAKSILYCTPESKE